MAIPMNSLVTSAVVIDVDEYSVAMLVGEQEEEWCFPAPLVPVDVSIGDELRVMFENGRPIVLGPDSHAVGNTMAARLNRPLNQRRITLTAC